MIRLIDQTVLQKKNTFWLPCPRAIQAALRLCGLLTSVWVLSSPPSLGQSNAETHLLPTAALSRTHFGNDHVWYERNIPFFACSDTALTRVYYYRWQLYKAHLKNLGEYGYIATEFLNEMSWDRKPYGSLNDATGFHLYEGRWLRDNRYARDYITYLYQHGGNDRHFSEYIADATWANHLVHPDRAFVTAQLPAMRTVYDAWRDHYDAGKGLYYIEPLLDATEYTIASIDASGGRDGFRGGDVFRPSINSYQFANARAIACIARLAGDTAVAREYDGRARSLRRAVQAHLWQPEFRHFADRYKVTNQYVTYWNFIRGRELAGYVPWAFNLPEAGQGYETAWVHLLDVQQFAGPHGLRTTEPSYEYYLRQYRYLGQQRECQWNGPSWPFQTSQVLLGMANVLHAPTSAASFTAADYLRLLTQYARQHYLTPSTLNLVEDYDADRGAPIVHLDQRSEHYNHSEFNDLLITGLCGLQPTAGDSLRVQPLVEATGPLEYFCLENVPYHGHLLTVLYDRTGRQYRQGAGLSVYVNGQRRLGPVPLGRYALALPPAAPPTVSAGRNLAVSLTGKGLPAATASFSAPDGSTQQAIDGRVWYFQDVRNRWSGASSPNAVDWLRVQLAQAKQVRAAVLHFYADGKKLAAPARYRLEYWHDGQWLSVQGNHPRPLANTGTRVEFTPVITDQLRVVLTHAGAGHYAALSEFELFD